MSAANAAAVSEWIGRTVNGVGKRSFTQRMLDGIEKAGNKVPHPVIIFLYLIVVVIILSAILDAAATSASPNRCSCRLPRRSWRARYAGGPTRRRVPEAEGGDRDIEESEDYAHRRSRRSSCGAFCQIEGIRFIFTSFVSNFANFSVVATIFVAMIGVGVAEQAGMMAALIRKLVAVTPAPGSPSSSSWSAASPA